MGRETQNTDISVRRLPPEEWWRLGAAYEATRTDEPPPRSAHGIVVVGELPGGELGVTVSAERVYCVSNFWAARRLRGSGLAERVAREIASHNVENMREMLVTTNRHVERLAHSMGFVPIEGTLWRR